MLTNISGDEITERASILRTLNGVVGTGTHRPLQVRQVSASNVLNEAYEYDKPSSFSRATTFDLAGVNVLLISGTASVGEDGQTLYEGDFGAQLWRTFHNITELLVENGMGWKNIVLTHCYLRDIDRDYDQFNKIRTEFYTNQGLDPVPASLGIQSHLCRPDLLVEIEAIALGWSGPHPTN
jgi:enamine deaminase RidA (YjgF/YER057c/UK114 family)